MQVHATLRLVGQWAQAVNALAIEIQFRGVLQTQHNGLCPNTGLGALPVRGKNVFPPKFVLSQKPIGRLRFSPATTGLRDAGHRVGRQLLSQQRCAFVQARIAKIDVLEFFCGPAHVIYPSLNLNQYVTRQASTCV